jgi:hypothetical protein
MARWIDRIFHGAVICCVFAKQNSGAGGVRKSRRWKGLFGGAGNSVTAAGGARSAEGNEGKQKPLNDQGRRGECKDEPGGDRREFVLPGDVIFGGCFRLR